MAEGFLTGICPGIGWRLEAVSQSANDACLYLV